MITRYRFDRRKSGTPLSRLLFVFLIVVLSILALAISISLLPSMVSVQLENESQTLKGIFFSLEPMKVKKPTLTGRNLRVTSKKTGIEASGADTESTDDTSQGRTAPILADGQDLTTQQDRETQINAKSRKDGGTDLSGGLLGPESKGAGDSSTNVLRLPSHREGAGEDERSEIKEDDSAGVAGLGTQIGGPGDSHRNVEEDSTEGANVAEGGTKLASVDEELAATAGGKTEPAALKTSATQTEKVADTDTVLVSAESLGVDIQGTGQPGAAGGAGEGGQPEKAEGEVGGQGVSAKVQPEVQVAKDEDTRITTEPAKNELKLKRTKTRAYQPLKPHSLTGRGEGCPPRPSVETVWI